MVRLTARPSAFRLRRVPLRWAALAAGVACAVVLAACFRDGGFVEPGEEKNLPVLAAFQGRANIKGTSLSGERMGGIGNPKIALVWQFVGPSAFGVAFDKISVDTRSPFKFSAEIRNPPPDSIAFSEEPVIGLFWLYSDGNENGVLDRIAHPKVAAHDAELAGMLAAYKKAFKALLEVSDISEEWVPYKDTFLLDSVGTFIRVVDGRPDTLFKSRGLKDRNFWHEVLYRRLRLLKNYNGWQNFFALRKKTYDFHRVSVPTAEHSYLQIFEDWRKLFPKPGKEAEFEANLRIAGTAYMLYLIAINTVQTEAVDSGWADYPYQGFDQPGTDWVVGKSTRYFVLYFPNRAALDRVLQAETWGSFTVDGIDRMHTGYNLLDCDEQYRCKVMGEKDSVYVDLADNEAFFNPPSKPVRLPIADFVSVPVEQDSLKPLEGRYEYRPERPILAVSRGGSLWCDVPEVGTFRLTASRPGVFYVPGEDLQFEFVATVGGRIGKVMMYRLGNRDVGLRTDSTVRDSGLAEKIDRMLARRPERISASVSAGLPGTFSLGLDSLMRVRLADDGAGIGLSYLGLPPAVYRPLNDSEAYNPDSDHRLAFARNEEGAVTGLRWSRPPHGFFLPNPAYKPRKPGDFFPDTGNAQTTPASESGGSGRDTYVDWGARRRYACAEDGRYLKAGDGWVEAVRKGATGDSISFRDPGDGLLFKVTGQAGKRVRLAVAVCGEKGGKQGGVLMDLRAGESAEGAFTRILAESDWVRPGDKGDTISFSHIPIPSDPYYLELRKVQTWNDSLYFSFDGYRAWSD